jgi:hypothetical protein
MTATKGVSVPFLDELVVRDISKQKWQLKQEWELAQPFRYQGRTDLISVPVGFKSDFASVPRPFWWLVPRYGRYTKAAVLHDYLCRKGAELEPPIHRSDADGIFRRSMRELRVDLLRRWIMWSAVRWGKWGLFRVSQGGWGEMFGAITISLLILPFVLPAASVVLASLFVFWLLKLIVYVAATFAGRRPDWTPSFTGYPLSTDAAEPSRDA